MFDKCESAIDFILPPFLFSFFTFVFTRAVAVHVHCTPNGARGRERARTHIRPPNSHHIKCYLATDACLSYTFTCTSVSVRFVIFPPFQLCSCASGCVCACGSLRSVCERAQAPANDVLACILVRMWLRTQIICF